MRTLQIVVPEKLAEELDALVLAGWFRDTDDVIERAISEFVGNHRLELMERFQRDDIEWALKQRKQ